MPIIYSEHSPQTNCVMSSSCVNLGLKGVVDGAGELIFLHSAFLFIFQNARGLIAVPGSSA